MTWRRWMTWFPALFGIIVLISLHSCVQFRMSSSAVQQYFRDSNIPMVQRSERLGERTIHSVEAGDSQLPLVVFIHGSPGSLSAFIHFLKDTVLLKRACLITMDRPGFGHSDFGVAEKTLSGQAKLLAGVFRKTHPGRKAIWVGHSLGGPVICRLAMDYPELVSGLVVVAGSIAPDLEPHEWYRAPLATPFLRWALPGSFRSSNDEIYHLKPELQDMLPLWDQITAPTIVIQGMKDVLVDPGNAEFARRMMTRAKVTLVLKPEMNHFVPWSNPELIRAAVLDLL